MWWVLYWLYELLFLILIHLFLVEELLDVLQILDIFKLVNMVQHLFLQVHFHFFNLSLIRCVYLHFFETLVAFHYLLKILDGFFVFFDDLRLVREVDGHALLDGRRSGLGLLSLWDI